MFYHFLLPPQAKALFHKLQNEEENSLKELCMGGQLNLQGRAELASPEQLREYETLKEKVPHIQLAKLCMHCHLYFITMQPGV